MRAKSIKGESPENLKKGIITCLADGFQPTLAIVFQSVSQDIAAVTRIFDDFEIAVYGATTNGEFVDDKPSFQYGHTALGLRNSNVNFHRLPINLYHFKDGIHIVAFYQFFGQITNLHSILSNYILKEFVLLFLL